ncbi:mutarotase [Echinicola sp. CAU 1574]|uniref:Mutarotase n=1 Tax=Echinicola arenosa TaxID=2774144 RepID=A0ABR9AQP7_9BACT|nr:2'-5' RNA ligase family protein [Echinicola arenosa]MBD8489934.1 mutarotase [Echinicola arenosa]
MDLNKHYDQLFENSLIKVKTDQYEIDKQIQSPSDSRRGLTLLARPSLETKGQIQKFLVILKGLEPDQYYYPDSDLHMTVLSIISCYVGFELKNIRVPDYIELVQKSLKGVQPFKIKLKGGTFSPAGILVKGYPENNTLQQLRNQLRDNFKGADLEQSLDKRYAIQTAHSTIMRFSSPLLRKEQLIAKIEQYKDHDFGSFTVDSLELVYNDWYQRDSKVKLLTKLLI